MEPLTETWRVSTRTGNSGACVEARHIKGRIEVRDTRDRGGPALSFSPSDWTTFITSITAGQPVHHLHSPQRRHDVCNTGGARLGDAFNLHSP
ncbi:DUF397 domain-containing protein [Micromonospora chokoriensis]